MLEVKAVGNDYVQIKGRFDELIVRFKISDKVRAALPIANSILMDRYRYDPERDLSEFHFIVVTNAIEKKTGEGYSHEKHGPLGQVMMGEMTARFVDAMMEYYDGNTPREMATSFACYQLEGAFA